MADPADFAALSFCPLNWRLDIAEQLRRGQDPAEILEQLLATRSENGTRTSESVRSRGRAATERAAHAGIRAVAWNDPAYPTMLAAIADPPPILWVRGELSALASTAVAIVGSRAASSYALAVAERLA